MKMSRTGFPYSYSARLIQNLPPGITYVGESTNQNYNHEHCARLGQFVVDTRVVSMLSIKSFRNIFPAHDYKVIKQKMNTIN